MTNSGASGAIELSAFPLLNSIYEGRLYEPIARGTLRFLLDDADEIITDSAPSLVLTDGIAGINLHSTHTHDGRELLQPLTVAAMARNEPGTVDLRRVALGTEHRDRLGAEYYAANQTVAPDRTKERYINSTLGNTPRFMDLDNQVSLHGLLVVFYTAEGKQILSYAMSTLRKIKQLGSVRPEQ